MKAVLTRVPVEAYAAALAPLGIEVVAMKTTRQTASSAQIQATARAIQLGPYGATIVTSAAAVRFLRMAAIVARAPGGTVPGRSGPFRVAELGEIWAVGPATRGELARDLETEVAPSDVTAPWPAFHPDGVGDAAGLARSLIATQRFGGARVFVPRAEDGRDDAISILRAAGIEVVEVGAYSTRPVPAADEAVAEGRELLAAGKAAYCCVFAPSQVAALAGIVGPLARLTTRFVAIGETTAAALREAGVTPLVAATPTPEGLAHAIALHSRPA